MRKEKIFWGVFFIAAAIFLIVSNFGLLPNIGIFKLIVTVFLASILIKSIVKVNFGGILFPLAFICMLYDHELGITAITPWPVLGAAILGTIGLSMLFRGRRKNWYYYEGEKKSREEFEKIINEEDGNRVFFRNRFGASTKYINSDNFEFAQLESSFGGMKVYFDNAVIQKGNATVQMDVNFSGVEMYIPSTWTVINQLHSTFGGVEEKGKNNSTGMPTLTLLGDVEFSGVTIIYV